MKELVVVTATWCGPCKSYKADVLEDTHAKTQIESRGYKLEILDADKNSEFCIAKGIRGVPATLVMVDGKVEATLMGKQTLESILKELK